VRTHGKRYTISLGTNHEGWSIERAQVELEQVMRQIERGAWEPPTRREAAQNDVDRGETVRVTAYRWWQRRKTELASNTELDYKWRLEHVLRDLGGGATTELDARRVDDFRQQLVGRGLSPRSVNMVLDLLAQVLDDAVEYGLLDANPARGRRRRMKVPKASRTFLEADMVVDVLDAAGAWERELPEHQRYGRCAFLATLCLSGPRISELIDSPLGRLDLHAGQLVLGKKTVAGIDRTLELSAFLLDELRVHLAALRGPLRDAHGAALPIFPTRTGGHLNASNIRNRLLNGTPAHGTRRPTKRRRRAGHREARRRGPDAAPRPRHPAHAPPDLRELVLLRRARPALGDGPARTRGSPDDARGLRAVHEAQPDRRGGRLAAHALRERARGARPKRLVWTHEWPHGALAVPAISWNPRWARRVSNLRPLACEAR
jgi:integrase